MAKRKKIRVRGKFSFMRFFQKFKEGDVVALVRDFDFKPGFPKRMHGRTGVVSGQRGSAYTVRVKDFNKEKEFVVRPIHLKKMEQAK